GRPPSVAQHNAQADEGVEQHQQIRDDEHPVFYEPAVNSKAYRRRHLSDEKPFRHALARLLLPLFINLFADGQHEYHPTQPADHFGHFQIHRYSAKTPASRLQSTLLSGSRPCLRSIFSLSHLIYDGLARRRLPPQVTPRALRAR